MTTSKTVEVLRRCQSDMLLMARTNPEAPANKVAQNRATTQHNDEQTNQTTSRVSKRKTQAFSSTLTTRRTKQLSIGVQTAMITTLKTLKALSIPTLDICRFYEIKTHE